MDKFNRNQAGLPTSSSLRTVPANVKAKPPQQISALEFDEAKETLDSNLIFVNLLVMFEMS